MSQQQPQRQAGAQFTKQGGSQQWTGQGGQQGVGQQSSGGQMGPQFRGRLSSQQRAAVTEVARAIEVCEWCADQCVQEADPNMVECIRLCEDVAELGEATLALASRSSRFAPSVVQSFQQAVQACAQECGRHHHDHCQECARILSEVATSAPQLTRQPAQQQL